MLLKSIFIINLQINKIDKLETPLIKCTTGKENGEEGKGMTTSVATTTGLKERLATTVHETRQVALENYLAQLRGLLSISGGLWSVTAGHVG